MLNKTKFGVNIASPYSETCGLQQMARDNWNNSEMYCDCIMRFTAGGLKSNSCVIPAVYTDQSLFSTHKPKNNVNSVLHWN